MITNTGSLCSNILNEETAFRPFQKNTGNFILSDVHLPCCMYIESANEGISEIDAAACCGLGGVQCDSQENTSVNPQNNTPPRPALLLSLAPARQHVCVMQVCAWCGRRCNIVHVVRHIRGAAGEIQPVIQAAEWVSCPLLDIERAASWESSARAERSYPSIRTNKTAFPISPAVLTRSHANCPSKSMFGSSLGHLHLKRLCVMEYPVSCCISRLAGRRAPTEEILFV